MTGVEIPRWAAALIVAVVAGLLILGGMSYLGGSGRNAPDNPAALAETQAAERPGDPPSGGQEQEKHQTAD